MSRQSRQTTLAQWTAIEQARKKHRDGQPGTAAPSEYIIAGIVTDIEDTAFGRLHTVELQADGGGDALATLGNVITLPPGGAADIGAQVVVSIRDDVPFILSTGGGGGGGAGDAIVAALVPVFG